ncbi:MAG: phage major capsid protein [Nocardioidaceae bacterium]
MTSLKQLDVKLSELANKQLAIVNDETKPWSSRKGAYDRLDAELKDVLGTRAALKDVHAFEAAIAGGPAWSPGGALTRTYAPPLQVDDDDMKGLHEALLAHKSYKVVAKTVSESVPPQMSPNLVQMGHEPQRIAAFLPAESLGAPSVEYLRHVSTTGAAGTVAAGALKPAVVLNTDVVTAKAAKIAVTCAVNDEDLADFGSFANYVRQELARLVLDEENQQLLHGDGTGSNVEGLLTTTGLIVRAKGASPETSVDTLELAGTDLRNGPAFVEPTLYVMSPSTWSAVRRTKDSQGRYLVDADPTQAATATLWGVPVIVTTVMTPGTAVALNAAAAATLHWRQPLTIQVDFGQTGFEHNQTAFRCEERVALATTRPSAICSITGLS